MGFVVVARRNAPGEPERLAALIYIRDGRTYWYDGEADVEYPQIPPNDSSLRALDRGTSQGDRRMTYVEDGSLLAEMRTAVRGQLVVH